MKRRASLALILFVLGCSAGSAEPVGDTRASDQPRVITPLLVDVSVKHQRIAGFGASSAWTAPDLGAELAEQFFSPETGLGLSLLRIQIRPDGTSFELDSADRAASYGVGIWASPWSPGEELKTNGSTVKGQLAKEHYGTWAQTLAGFAASMRERGTPLLGISAQNEPDYEADWDSCFFTPADLATFVGEHLVPALATTAPEVKVIAPEAANWNTLTEYSEALFAKPAVLQSLLAVATHEYSGSAFYYERLFALGQQLWATEISDGNKSTDTGMFSALSTAFRIHTALTVANVSAWHYWWLLPRRDVPDDNSALADRDFELTKRAYALGQFARFIRPEFVRVNTSGTLPRQVAGSGYLSPDSSTFVVVLISDRIDPVEQVVQLPGVELASVELWVTDATRSLEADAPPELERAGGGTELTLTLPANSVLTLVARTAGATDDSATTPNPDAPDANAPVVSAPVVSDG